MTGHFVKQALWWWEGLRMQGS